MDEVFYSWQERRAGGVKQQILARLWNRMWFYFPQPAGHLYETQAAKKSYCDGNYFLSLLTS